MICECGREVDLNKVVVVDFKQNGLGTRFRISACRCESCGRLYWYGNNPDYSGKNVLTDDKKEIFCFDGKAAMKNEKEVVFI